MTKRFKSFEVPEKNIQKVGSSKGVILPSKEIAEANLEVGDSVKVTIEPVGTEFKYMKQDILRLTIKFNDMAMTIKDLLGALLEDNQERAIKIFKQVNEIYELAKRAMDSILCPKRRRD